MWDDEAQSNDVWLIICYKQFSYTKYMKMYASAIRTSLIGEYVCNQKCYESYFSQLHYSKDHQYLQKRRLKGIRNNKGFESTWTKKSGQRVRRLLPNAFFFHTKAYQKELILPHTCALLNIYLLNGVFFQDLLTIDNVQLLHIMTFNSCTTIEGTIGNACKAIHDDCYTDCV